MYSVLNLRARLGPFPYPSVISSVTPVPFYGRMQCETDPLSTTRRPLYAAFLHPIHRPICTKFKVCRPVYESLKKLLSALRLFFQHCIYIRRKVPFARNERPLSLVCFDWAIDSSRRAVYVPDCARCNYSASPCFTLADILLFTFVFLRPPLFSFNESQ